LSLTPPEDAERDASATSANEHSFTVDIDESLMLDCSMVGGEAGHPGLMAAAVNGRLHIDRLKVRRGLGRTAGVALCCGV
jgi:hypothetical protein